MTQALLLCLGSIQRSMPIIAATFLAVITAWITSVRLLNKQLQVWGLCHAGLLSLLANSWMSCCLGSPLCPEVPCVRQGASIPPAVPPPAPHVSGARLHCLWAFACVLGWQLPRGFKHPLDLLPDLSFCSVSAEVLVQPMCGEVCSNTHVFPPSHLSSPQLLTSTEHAVTLWLHA